MSIPTPSPMQVFESGLHAVPPAATSTNSLHSLIRQKLEIAVHSATMASDTSPPMPFQPPESGSLLNDMGDYLSKTAVIWAQLTESLMNGSHINDAAMEAHLRARRETHLADLSSIAALDGDLDKLRKIKDLTAQYSRDVQAIWRPECQSQSQMDDPMMGQQSSISPFCDMKPLSMPEAQARRTLPAASQKAQRPPPDGSESDDSDEADEELFLQIDLDALKTRGKGTYYCPLRHRCTKGGVDKDSNLINFERNSSFMQHVNKHRKPYRCERENCPNPPKKRKFARRDGLERHLSTVAHEPPPPWKTKPGRHDPSESQAVKAESS